MIPEAVVAQIKDRTDLVGLISETVKLTRRGRSYTGLCPFHKEKTPSFHVNPERNVYHCFGCQEHGGAVDFLMSLDGYTFPEAVKVLAERLNIIIEETRGAPRDGVQKQDKEDLYAINNAAAMFFVDQLGDHEFGRYAGEELERRQVRAQAEPVLVPFRLGYAPAGWDSLAAHLARQGYAPGAAERAGLIVQRPSGPGHYDRFRHRLMFPVIDHLGRVIAFSGRALPELSPVELAHLKLKPAKDPPAKYINSPESPIYTKGDHLYGIWQAKQAIRQAGEAILVEGNFDVVSLHAHGFTNTVAPLGTAFTVNQAKLLKRFAHTATVLFDGDQAGRKATRAARQPCREAKLDARVATMPTGTDPDEFVRRSGEVAFKRVLGSARGMLETTLDDLLDHGTFASASLEEQGARVREATAILAECQDEVGSLATGYANKLATALVLAGVPIETMRGLMDKMVIATPPQPLRQSGRGPEKEILGALLDFPELLANQEVVDAVGVLSGDWALAVSLVATPWHEAADSYPKRLQRFVAMRTVAPLFESATHAKRVLLDNADLISRMAGNEHVDSLEVEMARWSKQTNE